MKTLDITSNILTIIATMLAAFTVVLVYLRSGRIKFGQIDVDFNRALIEKDAEAETFLETIPLEEKDKESDERKFALFLQYHSQGLAQSKISFWFSLIFAAIGFLIILTGILTVQNNISIWEQGRTFITLISGTVIDAVSALFFVQSNRARQLMTAFFDKLRADRKFEESLRLADQIPSDHLKSKVKILLSLNFADIKTSDAILTLILSGIERQPILNHEVSAD